MRHIIFEENTSFKVAILIKDIAFKEKELRKEYLNNSSIPPEDFIALSLKYDINDKAPVTLIKKHLQNVLKAADNLDVKILYVCDSAYFKTLTKQRKADPHHGYVMDCAIKGFEHIKVVLGINYKALFYNPTLKEKLDSSLNTVQQQLAGLYLSPGASIIHSAHYPTAFEDISLAIDKLHQYKELVCDIETFSLFLPDAKLGTIAFAWDENNGIAFRTDGPQKIKVYKKLKQFFTNYKGTLIFHNASYDIKVLIYELWMKADGINYSAMIKGLEVMTRSIHDTKIIAYCATNSTTRLSRSLKELSQEFAGNYAQDDIKDITLIDNDVLLQYNLIDCLSTWYVKNKYWPILVKDQQENVYNNVLMPSVKNLLQMELVGMPIDIEEVKVSQHDLTNIQKTFTQSLFQTNLIKDFITHLRKEECVKKNALLKVKVKPLEDFNDITYNPASNLQTRKLLYDIMGYEKLDLTKTGEPGVGAKTIKKLLLKAKNSEHAAILTALVGLQEVSIILNNFIKNFYAKSAQKTDNFYYMYGNFNLGVVVSGRLSSSDPNLQNIPSTGTIYAKYIKGCFKAPPGWLMMGADFASLEDRISALTTKDPNKLKVYTDGYDGHCLRAYSYFGDQMTGIVDTVTSINSIAKKYPKLRQASKAPTFLLTYGGTIFGLMDNVGLSAKEAYRIDTNYHELYKVSDAWVASKLDQATIDGHVTVAFGLRVRTPILSQTYLNKKSTPKEARAESRTAGNSLGQSYGLLTNRAGIEFQNRTLNSKHALDIMPIAQIHDALYFIVRDTYGVVKWFNDNLIECMEWQDLPELKHPTVKLGGEVDIFYPSWNQNYTLPNKIKKSTIKHIIQEKNNGM